MKNRYLHTYLKFDLRFHMFLTLKRNLSANKSAYMCMYCVCGARRICIICLHMQALNLMSKAISMLHLN